MFRPDPSFTLFAFQNSKKQTSFGAPMTIDKSLKIKAGSGAARNVYTRAERIEKLKEMEKFDESGNIYGLPKVRVVKISLKKKKKAKVEESDDAAAAE